MNRYTSLFVPYSLAFMSGMMIFVLEVLGARIVGPYMGSSLYVWTALIAVILLFMSLGSIYGGKIANIYSFREAISFLFLGVSVFALFVIVSDSFIASWIVSLDWGVRTSSIILNILLFGPTTFLLAAVFPVVSKKSIYNLKNDGAILGKLSMFSTYGSILGIGGTIFIFIPKVGIEGTLIGLSLMSFYISFVAQKSIRDTCVYITMLALSGVFIHYEIKYLEDKGIHTVDTLYSRIHIVDDTSNGGLYRSFIVDTRILSEYNMKDNDLTPYVTEKFYIFPSFLSSFEDVLMLGGAGYTFSTEFLTKFPGVSMDVVEIDSQMKQVAEDYFLLKDHKKLNIIHTDARYYLNTSEKKYDAIIGDVFSQLRTVPYQLASFQAIEKKYNALKEDGVVVENIISSLEGDTSKYLQAQYSMFSEIFEEVYIYVSHPEKPLYEVQNVFLVAVKGNARRGKNEAYSHEYLSNFKEYAPHQNIKLTDDYAPIENIVAPMNTKIRKNVINTLIH